MAVLKTIATALPRRVIPIPSGPRMVLTGSTPRPLWFDGRFLDARDLKREQQYFLQRQASLGRAVGSGVAHGLLVDQGPPAPPPTTGTIVIHAGHGITPSGNLVMITSDLTIRITDIASEEELEEQFGLSETPQQPQRTRTGVYVLALRPVEFTANPVTSYPRNLAAPRVTQDGDVVEATAVSLIPYPNPVNHYDNASQQAAVARQVFVEGNTGGLPDSVLPVAMIGLDRNTIQWIDTYLARRDAGPEYSSTRLGLPDPATQQAFLLQYDAQLQAVAASRTAAGSKQQNFPATDYFQALPAAGRLPLDAIDTGASTQTFFPPQMNVQLSVIPSDELPAVMEDSMSLSPIDLTLAPASYSNLSVYVLIPVPRNQYAQLAAQFQPTLLKPALPQLPVLRPLLQPLIFQTNAAQSTQGGTGTPWTAAINGQTFGFYVRLRSEPIFADFTSSGASNGGTATATTTTVPAPTTTPPPTTTRG
jgi:hypothetical protein